MSFNLITILKSSILSELDLSLNVIFQHYDDLETQLGYEPSFKQLEDHIFYHSHREEISDYEDYMREIGVLIFLIKTQTP